MFIAIHHNVTNTTEDPTAVIKYTTGLKDICAVFFYFLITIIMHAVLQEYIFDVSIYHCDIECKNMLSTIIFFFIENFQTTSSEQSEAF